MTTPDKEEMPTDRTAGRFRKKPVVINAAQWFRNGDHPEDSASEMFDYPDGCQRPRVIREGKIVRYYRHPKGDGSLLCSHSDCKKPMRDHGWIDTLEGGHIVCPGDYVITGINGEHYPCKPNIFAETYEPAALSTLPVNDRQTSDDVGILREALANLVKFATLVIETKFDRYKMRNGREAGIEADDGEKCWIVHSDQMSTLEGALDNARAALKGVPQPASSPSLEMKLHIGIANIKDELNTLALCGAIPMWTSLIGRLDDLAAELFQGGNQPASEAGKLSTDTEVRE